jgi:integrase
MALLGGVTHRCYTARAFAMALAHLARRGAVYYFRARLPFDLAPRLGVPELCRSLGTMDFKVARIRCVAATLWFHETTNRLRAMTAPTRTDLERAANAYFQELLKELSHPNDPSGIAYDEDEQHENNKELTRSEIERLDRVIRLRQFTPYEKEARALVSGIGLDFDQIGAHLQSIANQLVARAERQQMRYFLHTLDAPLTPFEADDAVFAERREPEGLPAAQSPTSSAPVQRPELTLQKTVAMYDDYLVGSGVGTSMRDETRRVLRWLQEEIDIATPVSAISRDQVREFRDCLYRLRSGAQGRKLPFQQRLTEDKTQRLKFVTIERYWRFVQGFLNWLQSEYDIANVAHGIAFKGGKNELAHSPQPFSRDETRRLLLSPLYSGYQSPNRLSQTGSCMRRDGHWWSGILLMHTGMRAGDVAQLLPSDFKLDDEVPHLLIQPGMLPVDGIAKRSKFGPRSHAVPLLPVLFELGLREFITYRAKRYPGERLLRDVSLGAHRASTGMTKFWVSYLQRHGLHSRGRGTHVWRHTVAARLREAHVTNEDIGAVLGHAIVDETATPGGYGGDQGLKRKLTTLQKLDHGIDFVELLGAFDVKRHKV